MRNTEQKSNESFPNIANYKITNREISMKQFFIVLILNLSVLVATAQNNKLLSPDEFLPHKIGETFTPHHLLVDYYKHVAANSSYVKLIEYGRTNEQRPLLLAFVSTPENLAKLEQIRLNHLRATGLETGDVDKSLNLAITWLSFSVHGNEAAGSESSMPVLYELVDPNNAATKAWLKNSIVILDPSINPDGYSRYTHWYRRYANTIENSDLASIEHQEPWPNGRVNHYLFDLNRDWAWLTQVESQQRLKLYNQWMPHVHADLHEMGINAPYYFAPAAQPYHPFITKWQRDFQVTIGKNHAKYFDKNGWLYFTKEVFDLFYPSYGDTYPVYNGSIGMTYEQGGSGRAGRAGQMSNGDVITLYDRVIHHKTTSLSTIEIASLNAEKLSENFAKFFSDSRSNPIGKYKTYIVKGTNPIGKLKRLTQLLDKHLITYNKAESATKVTAFDYVSGQQQNNISVEPGDLIISAYQPKSVLTQVLFDPEAPLVDSATYDITAWSLPYAHGLQAYATAQRINTSAPFKIEVPAIKKITNPYAYAVRWQSLEEAKFLSAILKAGIKVRYAERAFSVGNESFAPGTLVINQADNRKMGVLFQERFEQIASQMNQQYAPIATGFVDEGKDLGSDSYVFIEMPKVAVIGERPTFANEFGQVWHYFEQEIKYPLSILTMDVLKSIDLDRYNVLILPEGNFKFDDNTIEKLNDWVIAGGRLIAIGYANSGLVDKKGFALVTNEEDKKETENKRPEELLSVYSDLERNSISYTIPGAIFKINIDNTHPLGFGLEKYYFSLKTDTQRFPYLEDAWNVGYLGEQFTVYGFAGKQAQEQLKNSLVFGVQDKGQGSITYLIDNPLFRGFWDQGKFLFSNALFFVGQ